MKLAFFRKPRRQVLLYGGPFCVKFCGENLCKILRRGWKISRLFNMQITNYHLNMTYYLSNELMCHMTGVTVYLPPPHGQLAPGVKITRGILPNSGFLHYMGRAFQAGLSCPHPKAGFLGCFVNVLLNCKNLISPLIT